MCQQMLRMHCPGCRCSSECHLSPVLLRKRLMPPCSPVLALLPVLWRALSKTRKRAPSLFLVVRRDTPSRDARNGSPSWTCPGGSWCHHFAPRAVLQSFYVFWPTTFQAVPRRYGLWEPPQYKTDETGPEALAAFCERISTTQPSSTPLVQWSGSASPTAIRRSTRGSAFGAIASASSWSSRPFASRAGSVR